MISSGYMPSDDICIMKEFLDVLFAYDDSVKCCI